MKVFLIWLAGFLIAACVFIYSLKDSDFRESCGWPSVIAVSCAFAVWSWVVVAVIVMAVILDRIGGGK